MTYLLLKFAHLNAAAFFVGGVFFEVMILSRAAQSLSVVRLGKIIANSTINNT